MRALLSKYKDAVIGIVTILITSGYYYESLSIKDLKMTGRIYAATIPQWLCYGMWLLAVVLIFQNVRKVKAGKEDKTQKAGPINYLTFLLSVVLIVLYVLAIPFLGFCPASFLYLFAMFILLSPKQERNYLLFMIVAAIIALASYYVFRTYLNLMLPTGIMPF